MKAIGDQSSVVAKKTIFLHQYDSTCIEWFTEENFVNSKASEPRGKQGVARPDRQNRDFLSCGGVRSVPRPLLPSYGPENRIVIRNILRSGPTEGMRFFRINETLRVLTSSEIGA